MKSIFVFFNLFSERMLEVSHAVQCIFCVEHEPTVSDVYGRVIAAQSLSEDSMTSKLARGLLLILRLFNAPVTGTMHTASDLPRVKHIGPSTQNALRGVTETSPPAH